MADYYPLIARAIAGLDPSAPGESRRALYERARAALIAQLRSVDPPLSESEITRERLSLEEAVRRARAAGNGLEIEVEARTLEDVSRALAMDVQRILLDNMSTEMMRQAVEMTAGRAKLEASGNVTLDNVRRVAETGVDFISVGALTHSAKVFDVSFLYVDKR